MALRIALITMMALIITACASRNPLEVVVSRCPAVAVVGDAGTLTKFKGDSRLQKDMIFSASITDITSSCVQDDSVSGEVSFTIAATSGTAFQGSAKSVTYFVTILKDNSQIVSKKTFETRLNFNRDGQAAIRETIRQFIPTIEQARRYNYEILVGFQLSADEAVYNMRR